MATWLSSAIVLILVQVATGDLTIRHENVHPTHDDDMLCTSLPVEQRQFITEFKPLTNSTFDHHMLLYGCSERPGSFDKTWMCMEMSEGNMNMDEEPSYPAASICRDGDSPILLYAWAHEAPEFDLPKDVSVAIGPGSRVKYLVVQVHYKNTKLLKREGDNGGVKLVTQRKPTLKHGGLLLLASTDGVAAAGEISFFDIACLYEGTTIHPFAFRAHAHNLGVLNVLYRVRGNVWTELGRRSPQLPQMFADLTTPEGAAKLTIEKGDLLAARCVMLNNGSIDVFIGPSQTDEMCNLYLMFWKDSKRPLKTSTCGAAAQEHVWDNLPEAPENVNVNVGKTLRYDEGPLSKQPNEENDRRDYSDEESYDNSEDMYEDEGDDVDREFSDSSRDEEDAYLQRFAQLLREQLRNE